MLKGFSSSKRLGESPASGRPCAYDDQVVMWKRQILFFPGNKPILLRSLDRVLTLGFGLDKGSSGKREKMLQLSPLVHWSGICGTVQSCQSCGNPRCALSKSLGTKKSLLIKTQPLEGLCSFLDVRALWRSACWTSLLLCKEISILAHIYWSETALFSLILVVLQSYSTAPYFCINCIFLTIFLYFTLQNL